ncbi:MAG: hypothetical protein V9H25_13640 [Candidatus Competibacter sp.]
MTVHHPRQGFGLLKRVQILPLDVFDECDLFSVAHRHDSRNRGSPQPLERPEPPLAGH